MEAAALGPVLGWMLDRFGAQGMIRMGIIVFGVGFMLLSQIDTLPRFYAAFVCRRARREHVQLLPDERRDHPVVRASARARSPRCSSAARSAAFSVRVVAWSIQTYGWRATAFASGVIIIVIGWPLARVIRRRPEDDGETVDGLPPAPTDCGQRHDGRAERRRATSPRARRCAPARSG